MDHGTGSMKRQPPLSTSFANFASVASVGSHSGKMGKVGDGGSTCFIGQENVNRKFAKLDPGSQSTSFNMDHSFSSSTGAGATETTALRGSSLRSFSFESTARFAKKGWDKSYAKKGWEMGSEGFRSFSKHLHSRVRVFQAEKHQWRENLVLDPNGSFIHRWNQVFVASCLVAIFVDPLFFFLPVVEEEAVCIHMEKTLAVSVTVLRSFTDVLYVMHIILQFRTAFVAPSSRVFGRGELVTDVHLIAKRYVRRAFWLDLIAVIPLPQIVTWILIPLMRNAGGAQHNKNILRLAVVFNYLPRVYRIAVILTRTTGKVMETAWAGAAYNLLLYMLASHVVGACWYVLAVERQISCLNHFCRAEEGCDLLYLDCDMKFSPDFLAQKNEWHNTTQVGESCSMVIGGDIVDPKFNYGIYIEALSLQITTMNISFMTKYFYCLWFGLLNLSSLGQNLQVSTYVWDAHFAIAIVMVGIVLFALLIGNMQQYLDSMNVKKEEMRTRKRDTEQWMVHRQLPQELRERVRRYDHYKWVATKGVDEGELLQSLPLDLRREIKRYLCLDLVRRVPMFDEMDSGLLDAICEKLQPVLHTENSYLLRDGDPILEMVFIIRGHLESTTIDCGRTFTEVLHPGDFCGEELLTWALDPRTSKTLPTSTRSIQGLKEVEGFSLAATDLRDIAAQFRKMHSKQLQHTFRYYSHQWRTWAVRSIQAAWGRHQRRKLAKLIEPGSVSGGVGMIATTLYASKFASNAMRVVHRSRSQTSTIPKPVEPDFSADLEE